VADPTAPTDSLATGLRNRKRTRDKAENVVETF
jgi:hypothetical protein